MSPISFIIGMAVLGVCIIIAAVILSGAITGAAAAIKENTPKAYRQPELKFMTEFDAADYLGLNINELDYARNEGLLDGTFIAITSLEQTGVSEQSAYENGVEVTKTTPIKAQVTRFMFDRDLLDKKLLELIRDGKHINPYRRKNKKAKAAKTAEKPIYEEPAQELPEEVPTPAEDPAYEEPANDEQPTAEQEEYTGYALPDDGDESAAFHTEDEED